MKFLFADGQSANWYFKYVGLPLSVGMAIYTLFSKLADKRRRAALRGKVVVITGASSGIGEALAHAFYDQGSKVVLAARRKTELERVKGDLQSKKLAVPTLEPVCIELDLGDLDHIEDFSKKVYNACGTVDILINNGGISYRGNILHSKMDVYQQIMNVNYFGSVALTKAVLPKMVENRSGHIVFISSIQGLIAIPDRAAYAASKHAIQAFGDSLRAEMYQHNVNVTMVSPGYIITAVSLNALTSSGEKHGVMDAATASGLTPQYTAEKILDSVVKKENDLVVSQFVPKFAVFIRHFAPSIYHYLMAKRAEPTKLTVK
ncbi:dehydrogenase/reductase SDR family protein 7-like [Ostrinia furnacalis]|uniref:dehydrogenase/reductase SDR family protein 7-like n=1 Tax=Ostrinia furnacalis TaxID=93504 RepID=UPI00103EDA8B|nr:dehydrogenase/reductase SDR family protein 7-like [Ostrinia furnacalis]